MTRERRWLLWQQLATAGMVSGEPPQEQQAPWYVRVMLGISGWIGASFLLVFVGIAFTAAMQNAAAAAATGLICTAAAYAVFRHFPASDFAGQFGLALGQVGQALFGVAVFKLFNGGHAAGFFLYFLVEAALTVVMPNFLHRLFTSLAGLGALYLGLGQAGLHGLALPLMAAACALLWRSEPRLGARLDLWHPVGYALAIALLLATALSLTGAEASFHLRRNGGWLPLYRATVESSLVAMVFLATVLSFLRELAIKAAGTTGTILLVCAILVMAASFPVHGLAVALLVLFLGFGGGNRILVALGLLACTGFMVLYYYRMQETLLFKSMMLGATGTALLAGRRIVRLLLPHEEVRPHA